jgi:alkylation response protein AidB-like acyl-CoA dehydrogenase
LASACLTTAFVLTQRNGACQRIAALGNENVKLELLPGLCRSETFATVGISHLTTSGQHLRKPAVSVRTDGDDFIFDGTIPWVTGANHAEIILTGGTCDDGKQVLGVIATDAEGVQTNQPPRLLSMNASQTGSVNLDNVRVTNSRVIAGPVEAVMKQGSVGATGSLTTSALAVGASEGTLLRLKSEAENRPELAEIYDSLAQETETLATELLTAAQESSAAANCAEPLRKRANSLVLRTAQAYLGATKGAGFVQGHPAERAVREAMFFLVWSCPQPVLTAALREFACLT